MHSLENPPLAQDLLSLSASRKRARWKGRSKCYWERQLFS